MNVHAWNRALPAIVLAACFPPGSPDGSQGEAPAIATATSAVDQNGYTTVDFDDLVVSERVAIDRYLSSGVEIRPAGGGRSRFVLADGLVGPCNGTRAIQTSPFTGPGFKFRFLDNASSVTVSVGDFGPSDQDEIMVTAYADDDLARPLVTRTKILPDSVTGCVTLTVSAPGIKVVTVGSASTPWGTPNSIFIDDLHFTRGPAFFGADTNVQLPYQFPTAANSYDYYLGQVGHGLTPCAIPGLNVNGGLADCHAFKLDAARAARSTNAYWYLKGPNDYEFDFLTGRLTPAEAGVRQAEFLVQQWNAYNAVAITHDASTVPSGVSSVGPVIDGRTLFGDIEPPDDELPLSDAGWFVCDIDTFSPGSDCEVGDPYPANASALGLNRQLLEGFLRGLSHYGDFSPGIYTNPTFWLLAFGQDYRAAPTPALWLSCIPRPSSDPLSSDEALAYLPAAEDTVLGGARTVLWQYRMRPDYDLLSGNLLPKPDFRRTYQCSCGWCPFSDRTAGLYLVASPVRLTRLGGWVTLTNPLDETIEFDSNDISISSDAYSQINDCTILQPGESCTIEVIRNTETGAEARLSIHPDNKPQQIVPIGNCGIGVVGCSGE